MVRDLGLEVGDYHEEASRGTGFRGTGFQPVTRGLEASDDHEQASAPDQARLTGISAHSRPGPPAQPRPAVDYLAHVQ
jgi:hypothetical protein